ncbi:acyclic terpene utilization AtuA family protein [Clostridiisalibacter paucivorans]|uniref:acyclic terpene utilization AtuA family protein n=1 Tax=Clostridiisalibacter paucivorans TaxID=408753 RepID=UPI00047939A4|nr:acyclic terpene utilization AtuA family protein [Clostridiisalibacter paucivorans]
MKSIKIGCGAGYAGDRIEPAIEMMEKSDIDYIAFECLAERTIAIAQQEKMKNPQKGYNHLLEYRMRKILPICKSKNIKVITNMGAANPEGAIRKIKEIAQELNIKGLKIAAVIGDNIYDNISKYMDMKVLETEKPLKELEGEIVSANAYLGVDGILQALENDSDIIITGRVADPALFLAPMIYEFNWSLEDYEKIGKGTLIGHLLECGGQITGGYFADPGYKDVDDLYKLGFPIANVYKNGDAIITKVQGSGGKVTESTCKEQLLYEIHDPKRYITPDVIADFSNVSIQQIDNDQVQISGGNGIEKTDTLKASIGYFDCFIGEGEISYGGPGAYERAKLAGKIVEKRLKMLNISTKELRIDLIGINSLYKDQISNTLSSSIAPEVRLRVAARTKSKENATTIGNEVEALYTNGPAAGGGATKSVKKIISMASIFIPRKDIDTNILYEEV